MKNSMLLVCKASFCFVFFLLLLVAFFVRVDCKLNLMTGEELCSYQIGGVVLYSGISRQPLLDELHAIGFDDDVTILCQRSLFSSTPEIYSGSRTALGRFLSTLRLVDVDLNSDRIALVRLDFAKALKENPGDKYIELHDESHITAIWKDFSAEKSIVWTNNLFKAEIE